MTQSVSSGAGCLRADFACSERSGAESDTFSCDETHEVRCAAKRAHGAAMPWAVATASVGDVPEGLAFCREADTVIEGFLCGEPVVVSNACRKPRNSFDEFVCDDPKMQRVQWAILRETWAIVKALALTILRGKP
jgi:hypothetical protein